MNDPDALSQHLESSRIHGTLHHPSIVSLLSTFTSPDAHHQVFELCVKGNLASFLDSRSAAVLTEPEARGVLKSLVLALIHLSKHNVLHRDIKPDNVLLTADFRVVCALMVSPAFVDTDLSRRN